MNQQILFRPNPDFFVVGGTIRGSAASYVERAADRELLENLCKGESCYILTTRQMGKSSLVVRTAAKLKNLNISSAFIDLTSIGKNIESEAWYLGQIKRIQDQLCPHVDYLAWWEANANLSEVQRYVTFLSEILLAEISNPVVLFVDEIESVLETAYGDDYFAALRSIYNQRASNIKLQRLNFVLLGTASLSDLIKEVERTPFNIGKRIDLNDFTLKEAQSLAVGLAPTPELATEMLKQIMNWTDGHPYITQKVCSKVAFWAKTSWDSSRALSMTDEIVRETFLSKGGQDSDEHIQIILNRLIKVPQLDQLLKQYRRIWQKEKLSDDARNPIYSTLKLSGIVKTNPDGLLEIRNKVYYHVFDLTWINSILSSELIKGSNAKALSVSKRRPIVALALVFSILMTILVLYFGKDNSPLFEVSIFTQPDTTVVFLNGDSLGVTPLKFSSRDGASITLRLQKPGYFSLETAFVIPKGQDSSFFFVLHPIDSISIFTQPTGAAAFLNGDSLGVTPLNFLPRDNSAVKLLLQKPDYFPLDTAFVIRKGHDSIFTFALQPAARISIKANPAEARFILDGELIPSARLININLPVGPHRINILAEGYMAITDRFSLSQGFNPERVYTLSKIVEPLTSQPSLESISISSDPPGADIFVNGKLVGVTPMMVQMEEGNYQILLQKDGYKEYSTSIKLNRGQKQSVNTRFIMAPVGTLNILVSPFGSLIYINEKFYQENTDRQFKTELAVGEYLLKVVNPNFGTWEKNIKIIAGESLNVTIDFNKSAKLTVTSTPVFGEIFVDGISKGYTPKQLTLRVGKHSIELRREGYFGETRIINLEDDLKVPLLFTLTKNP